MIITDESNEQYHANPAISSSQAKDYTKSPRLLRDRLDGIAPRAGSSSMDFGTVVHQRVLEPDADQCWVVKPAGVDFRTKAGRQWRDDHSGQIILTTEDADRIDRMLDRMPPAVLSLLESVPDREVTYRRHQVECAFQARPDAIDYSEHPALIVDLKTTSNFDDWDRDCHRFGYEFSAGWYAEIVSHETDMSIPDWVWIVAETQAPYRWQIVAYDRPSLIDSVSRAMHAMKRIAISYRLNRWDDVSPIHRTYTTPAWARKE